MDKKKVKETKSKSILTMDIKDIKKLLVNKRKSKKNIKKSKDKKDVFKRFRRAKNVIAFDIGHYSIKMVEGSYFNDKLSINKLVEISTPQDVICDGKIMNVEYLAELIAFNIKESNIKAKNAICTTNSSTIINRELIIHKVEDDEMETVIRFEIQQYLPINLDDYIIQYNILDEINDMGKEKLKLNVISYPEKMAYGYFQLLEKCNLKPYALDITHNSLNKLIINSGIVNSLENNIKGTSAFIDMGATSINVTIYKNGKLDFTRILKIGGDDINYAINQRLGIPMKTIEHKKIEYGNLFNFDNNVELNNVIRETVADLLDELERVFQFYKNKSVGNKIDKIYLYGGTSNLIGMKECIDKKFEIPTERVDDLKNVNINKLIEEPITQYVNAIGSIIRL